MENTTIQDVTYRWGLKESMVIDTMLNADVKNEGDYIANQVKFERKYGLNSNDGKIHVLMVGGDQYGCGYVRIFLPSKYLNRGKDIVAFPTLKITAELIQWAHIVVWQRQHKQELVRVRDIIEKAGRINVFEIDDNLHEVPKSNPAYYFYNPSTEAYKKMLEWIKSCSILTCTREELGEYYKEKTGVNYSVLPNSLDFEVLPQPKVNDTGRLRIGWVGSSTHQEDLQLIVYAIKELQKEYDFDFVMFGWDGVDMARINGNLIPTKDYMDGVKRESHKFVEIEDYMNKLSDLKLDIGLCPVVDGRFNKSGKSPIKFLEYSMLYIPTVVSKVSCYTNYVKHGETALVAQREADWYKQIKKLIESRELRQQLAQNAHEYVKENYDMAKNVTLWADLYRNIYNQHRNDGTIQSVRYVPPSVSDIQGAEIHRGG